MEETKTNKRRGRPPKNKATETLVEINSSTENVGQTDTSFEFNSFSSGSLSLYNSIFNCGVYDFFSKEEIDEVLRNPIVNHETAIRLSEFVYSKSGVVSNSIDYCTSLLTLDKIILSKNGKHSKKIKSNIELAKEVLSKVDDKSFIRDALFTNFLDGIAFYYFEKNESSIDKTKYFSDYEIENIVEINDSNANYTIISLPWQYTRIVGKRNGRYVLAFNLDYFMEYTGERLDRKLRKYPKEISDGYRNRMKNNTSGNWLILNTDNTMCVKIKCKDSEAWGRSLIIAALTDVLYKDYFVDTKRNVLNETNSRVIYETFPENKQGTGSILTASQQQKQHDTVKSAIMQKNNRGGTTFISLACGTKLDSLDISTDIFDSKNEANLNNDIAMDLGIASALIGAMTTGNYSGTEQNLKMITSQVYDYVSKWCRELVHVINKNVIKDKNNEIDIYYFPTSFVNRKETFDMMKDLYTNAGGSLKFLIASAGVDPDIYLSVCDSEIEDNLYEKYKPHQTSFTMSNGTDDVGGRPKTDNPTQNTIRNNNIGGNDLPSPSDNK